MLVCSRGVSPSRSTASRIAALLFWQPRDTRVKPAIRPRIARVITALAFASGIPCPSMAQENARDLMPRLGETRAEFEARINGLERPATSVAPSTVTIPADARGHFYVQATVNGASVRMMVDTGAT